MLKATQSSRASSAGNSSVGTIVLADNSSNQPTLNISAIMRRQMWLILACIGQGLALAVLYWMHAPEKFESRARVMVSQRSPQMSSTTSGTSSESIVDEDVLSNHMEVIRSRRIVETALTKHSLDKLTSITAHLKENEDAADYVIDNLKLTRGGSGGAKGARILSISFEHEDADNARRILEAIVVEYQIFLSQQLSKAMSEANNLIKEAQENLEADLNSAQQKYVEVREKAPVLFQGEGSGNVFVEQFKTLHKELLTLDIRQSNIELRLQKAKDVYGSKGEGGTIDLEALGVIDLDSLQRLGVFAGLQTKGAQSEEFLASQPERLEEARTQYTHLLQLMSDEQKLRADFGENHPKVRQLAEQIELTRKFVIERRTEAGADSTQRELTPERLLKAYIGFLENDINECNKSRTEMQAMLADAESQARTLVEFELQEGILRSRVDRTQQLFDGLVEQLRELDMASGMRGFIHEVLESPRRGEKIWPRFSICGAAGLLLGLIAGLVLGAANDQMDGRFRSSDEIDSFIDLPVLVRINRLKLGKDTVIVSDSEPESEAFRMLRTIMLSDVKSGKLRVISGTSPVPGDGKSTILANISATFAKLDLRVLYLEADMRRPNAHLRFNVPEEHGLSDILRGRKTVSECLKPTEIKTLTVITAGSGTLNPSELLQSAEFDTLLSDLRGQFDLVVVDVGPVLAVSDPMIVAQKTDATLLIIRSANDTRQEVAETVSMLRSAGANLLGCIVNTIGSGNEFERVGYYGYYGDSGRDLMSGSSTNGHDGSKSLTGNGSRVKRSS
jgi:capsular exopolysaccharide synthesis family protein